MKRYSAVSHAVLILFAAASVLGQGTNASVSGTVQDPTGAIVANAQMTAQNMRTGVTASTVTNDAGVYTFPSLQPGLYRLAAEAPGFQTYSVNDVSLEVGARININISLVVAGGQAALDVTASPDPLLLTNTATVGGVITGQRVQDLPLPDRDALGLVFTQAGVTGSNFAGSRIGALNVTLDGVPIADPFINSGVSSAVFASVDAVEEVRVITSPVDAELGRGSGQVMIATKSGGNEFHGSVWEFHRNTVLNANNWFNNLRGESRDSLILNQFGARLGGPIVRERTFFHFTYEGIRERTGNVITVPTYTAAAREGFFRFYPGVRNANADAAVPTVDLQGNPVRPAGALGDLQTINVFGRDPNRLGLDRTGTIARLLRVMPLPNDFRSGDGLNVAGFTWQSKTTQDLDQYNGRMDHQFNQRHRLSGTYVRQTVDALGRFMPRPFPQSPAGSQSDKTNYFGMQLSSTLSATKLNEFRAGFQRRGGRFNAPWELPGGAELLPTSNGLPYLPVFGLVADPVPGDNDPQGRISPLYVYEDTFHLQRGKHALKFGGDLRFTSSNAFNSFGLMPRALLGLGDSPDVVGVNRFTIPGLGENEGIAQGLLMDLSGSVANVIQTFNASFGPEGRDPIFTTTEQNQRTWRQREFSLFVQDDFKLKPSITLNLGVRYDFYGVPWEANGRAAGLVAGSAGLFGITGRTWSDMYRPGRFVGDFTQVQLIGRGSPNPNQQLYDDDWNNFGPVIGLSWSIPYFGKDKTVLRAGYSVNYERLPLVLTEIIAGNQPGLQTTTVFSTEGYVDLSGVTLPLLPEIDPLEIVPLSDRVQAVRSFDNNLRTPYIQNWNLTIQRQLPANFTLDVRYVGSKGTKLVRSVNINELNIFENGILDAFLVTQAGGNAPLLDRLFAGFNLGLGTVNGTTVTGSQSARFFANTGASFANNGVAEFANFINQISVNGARGGLLRRAFLPENFVVANPQFGSANLTSNFSNSTYHSLQINAERRLFRGLQVQSNYTWSRTLGDEEGSSQSILNSFRNGRDRRVDKRLLAFHRTHVARNNATWELPFGPGRRFFSGAPKVVSKIIEGWELSSIFNLFSGAPIGLASGVASFNQFADNTATEVGPLPRSTGEVKKIDNGVVYFDGLKQVADPAIANITQLQLLQSRSNMQALTDASGRVLAVNPTPGKLGTFSQTHLQGPGSFRLDMNLIKTFSFGEGRELEFRADAIDVLNTPFFGNPNTDINSSTFGRITNAFGERVLALSARINF